jgi:hypothetical protein
MVLRPTTQFHTARYCMNKIVNLWGPIQFKTMYGESIRITFYLLEEHCIESLPMGCYGRSA